MTSTTFTSSPAGILRLASSFCDAKALLTGVELGVFTLLHDGPASTAGICERLGLNGRGAEDWLNLLAELGLLETDGDRYWNSPDADRFLVQGGPFYVGGFISRSNNNLYPAWGRLSEALRTGQQQSGSDFGRVLRDPQILAQFVNSMDSLTRVLGPQLIETYDGWASHGSVLDVGGCRGNLVTQIVKAHPGLSASVFDLPEMKPFCEELTAAQGLAGKVTFHGGDFFTDALPAADVVILGHVLHDWDRAQRKLIVGKAYESVNPGGVLLAYDRMLDRASARVENLVISLDMLLVTDGGSEYAEDELRDHMAAAGFTSAAAQPLGEYDTLMVARKAG